ncbi:MAG: 50S ribosomal protein L9 [Candidatus Taylorbacteria bacterium RIFCSPLOWO2_01_FULL_45_15b]|uniref:Large ribosomal subunit protein bL9 n=1 Tax=Candidatus Taylorbacteria bacterium RIFCSPLOWO2_01_FULL_45_15b TaxID=1802319 RepID=A0A1G2NG86_9BACT|nr:MAG: 50S ribosomal protein L9 [Candidatus Taylorbacteria bacterium RIFCSPLOWO2_01_FULL_45_15b]
MKIVLLKDVANVGKKFDIKNVPDGFAVNRLIPRLEAALATDKLVKSIESKKSKEAADSKARETEIIKTLEKIREKLIFKGKVNEKGNLFAAIHKTEIIALIKEISGAEISESAVELKHPIKEAGDHAIEVKIGETMIKLSLKVEKE